MKKFSLILPLVLSTLAFAASPQKMTFEEIQQLSAQGNIEAQTRLGEAYLNGNDEQKVDYQKAFGWTNKAAAFFQKGDDNNDTTAQYHLAKLYEQGLGVARDYQKAISLYLKHEKRVDHITAPSFLALGDIYALGLSVEKNLSEAQKWYALAVKAGSQEAKEKLADLATKSY